LDLLLCRLFLGTVKSFWERRMSSQPVLSRRRLIAGVALALPSLAITPAFAQSASQRVLQTKKISIGIHNRSPWGFRRPDGQIAGVHPDLVRAAFAPLGVTEMETTIADFGALIPGLTANRFDIVASGLGITPERCKVVAFSDPDLAIGDGILVAKGNPLNIHSYEDVAKNPKIRLGASRGSANAKNAQMAGIPEAQLSLFQNTEATVSALKAGRVDAIAFSSSTVIALLEDPNITDVERALPFKGYVKPSGREVVLFSSVAFRQADADLRDLYNKRLAEMKADGSLAALMKKYGFAESEVAPPLTQEQICRGED
jgi:polar amino acid transport system substrate-binding protein